MGRVGQSLTFAKAIVAAFRNDGDRCRLLLNKLDVPNDEVEKLIASFNRQRQ